MNDTIAKRPFRAAVPIVLTLILGAILTAGTACAADLEKCYGIAKAGQDDGSSEIEVPGMSTVDYQGNAFKYVTKGTCEAIVTPFGPGSLKPIDNRPPKN